MQFDIRHRTEKVLGFLHPFYEKKYGYVMQDTFRSAIDPAADKLHLTWNGNRGGPGPRGCHQFNTCALTIVHILESERAQ